MAALDIERESVKRDTLDLNRARRLARRRGDMEAVLRYTKMGKEAGLPVGRRVHDEELQGVAERQLAQNTKLSGQTPEEGGLDGFDFRHSSAGGPGVGGYDFSQRSMRLNRRPSVNPTQEMETGMDPSAVEMDPEQPPEVTPRLDRAAGWRKAWQTAQSQEEKDDVVARADSYGIPLSDAGREAISRRSVSLAGRRIRSRLY